MLACLRLIADRIEKNWFLEYNPKSYSTELGIIRHYKIYLINFLN